MAKPQQFDKLSSELESRLDELFREDEPPAEARKPGKSKGHPLDDLKKIVLSIDWEITPEAIDSFLDQVRLLKEVYQRDKVTTMFLQILGSLGQYIKSSRSRVNPATFGVLNSVFARLDEVVNAPKMPEPAKRRLLQAEMAAYQELREKISQRKVAEAPVRPEKAPAPEPESAPPVSGAVTPAMLAQAVAELKEHIRAEINALRQQLRTGGRQN